MSLKPLADEFITLMSSPDPEHIWSCSPGLCRCPDGRLIATAGWRGPDPQKNIGLIFVSDDHGATWRQTGTFPFRHARPFIAGKRLYILGHDGDLCIVASSDRGENWSAVSRLTSGQHWHQAPCNVLHANGCVYLVMERSLYDDCHSWEPSTLAPVLMRGAAEQDLRLRENWTFATEVTFRDAFSDKEMISRGMSFFPITPRGDYFAAPGRESAPPGWLETNVFQLHDRNHYWFDPAGKTFHLISRLHCGWTGYAALLKVTEDGPRPGTGAMHTGFQTLPSGGYCNFLPLPGGQMKFHLLYDDVSRLYWLLSTQATDSMTRAEKLSPDRYNLPNNQRTRLMLHFSRNMIDWCPAGMVAMRSNERESRHYASMVIDGDDLAILSRSGDERAASAHNGNLITFHRLKNFRDLIY